jgi:Fe-S cluster biogenesis protein NfuA
MVAILSRQEAPKPMVNRERVQSVIDRIRPVIQADGGDIELVDVIDNKARVRMSGNCVGCPSAQMTLYMGIETALKDEIPEFEELLVV